MFSVFYPQLTLIFGSLLDLNCTCSFHKALLFISPCAAEMSVCLPLQQKVMSRGGLGNFLHIRDIVTSAMGCVFSTGCNSAPFSVHLYQGHPISLYKERVQEDLGRQSCAFWQPLLQLVPSCPEMEGREGEGGRGGEGIRGLGNSRLLCALPCLSHPCGRAPEPLNLSTCQFAHLPGEEPTI